MVSTKVRPVKKLGDVKFLECPLSAIRDSTWRLLHLVNDTITSDGDMVPLFEGHPALAKIRQAPNKWHAAVQIVRYEREDHRRKELKKLRGK